MPKFALIKIEQVKGKINFYKLEIDGTCEFDEFCQELDRAETKKVLISIYATMESVANLSRLPGTKFKDLRGRKETDKVKDFEIKKDAYRVYLFKDDVGNIIVFGGSKNTQKKDIARLRRLKEEFLKNKKT